MDRSAQQIESGLQGYAKRLLQVGKSADPLAGRLIDLGKAVTGKAESNAWGRIDLGRVIDPAAVADRMHRIPDWVAAIVAVLEWARNLLILLPLAITWLGLADALHAYQAAVAANGQLAQQSFLLLWQTGFDGKLEAGRELSAVATNVVWSIGGVIVLTMLTHGFDNLWRRYVEHAREDTQIKIDSLLGEATLALAARTAIRDQERHDALVTPLTDLKTIGGKFEEQRKQFETFGSNFQEQLKQQLDGFNSQADTLIRKLEDEVHRVNTQAEAFTAAVKALNVFATGLNDAVKGHGELVTRSEQAATTIAAAAGLLQSQVQQLGQEQARLVTAATGLTTAAERMLTGQLQLGRALNAAVDQQTTAARTFVQSASQLENVGTALAGSHQAMLDSLKDAANTLAGNTETLESILVPLPAEMKQLLEALTTTGQQQAGASGAVQQALAALQTLLSQQASQINQLQQLDQTLQHLGNGLADLGQRTQAQATANNATTQAQQRAIAELTQVLQGVRQSVVTLEADRQRTASRWSDEQAAREQVTKTLEAAGMNLRDSMQRFDQMRQVLEALIRQVEQLARAPAPSTPRLDGAVTAPYGPSQPSRD